MTELTADTPLAVPSGGAVGAAILEGIVIFIVVAVCPELFEVDYYIALLGYDRPG